MSWQMGYKKPNGAIGSMNQVLGVSGMIVINLEVREVGYYMKRWVL